MALASLLATSFTIPVGTALLLCNAVTGLPTAADLPKLSQAEGALSLDAVPVRTTAPFPSIPLQSQTVKVKRKKDPKKDMLGFWEEDTKWRGFGAEATQIFAPYPLMMPMDWLLSHFSKGPGTRAYAKESETRALVEAMIARVAHQALPCGVTNRLSMDLAHAMNKGLQDRARQLHAERQPQADLPFIPGVSPKYVAHIDKYMDRVVEHAMAEARHHHHRRQLPQPPLFGNREHIVGGPWGGGGPAGMQAPVECPSLMRDEAFNQFFEAAFAMAGDKARTRKKQGKLSKRTNQLMRPSQRQPNYHTCARAVRVAIATTNISPSFPPWLPPVDLQGSPFWSFALSQMRNDTAISLKYNSTGNNATASSRMPPLVVLYRDGHVVSYLTGNHNVTDDTLRHAGERYAHRIANNLCQEQDDDALDEDEQDEFDRELAQMDLADEETLDYATYQRWHLPENHGNDSATADDDDDNDETIPVDIAILSALGRAIGKHSLFIRAMVEETLNMTDPLIVGWDQSTKVPIFVYHTPTPSETAGGVWEYVP